MLKAAPDENDTLHVAMSDAASAPTVLLPSVQPGAQIGHYHLLEKVGEGGMGEVWLAEQKEPVRRRVALKVIKAGMDSRDLIARFESERQALALMDHPAIAKVYDAGSSSDGLPYFVMEYVAGLPITGYCDKHKLSISDRLRLFVQVCGGVQHAHQKAIIHRDLKPSNILVKEEDGCAVPKIIDFGVAKALTQKLTEGTMYTKLGTLIGTAEYMSPEQADPSGEDIDTRADVYSLGVILFEMLVGVPPLDLKTSTFSEIIRRLREEDAPKPSSRFRTVSAQTAALVQNRGTSSPVYTKQLRGDLDAITLKALEKDRSRRYGSAAEFAADISRHLNCEPVLAVAPSLRYRLNKFARRNRGLMAAVATVAILLVVGTIVSVWLAVRAVRAERIAETEAATAKAVNEFLQDDLLSQASATEQTGGTPEPDIKVRTLVDRAAAHVSSKFRGQPLVESAIRDTIGATYRNLGLYSQADTQLQKAYDLSRQFRASNDVATFQVLSELASVKADEGNEAADVQLSKTVFERESQLLGDQDPRTVIAMQVLGVAYLNLDQYAAAEPLLTRALAIQSRTPGYDNLATLNTSDSLATLFIVQGKFREADALLARGLPSYRRLYGPEHPYTQREMFGLARVQFGEGKYPQAEDLVRQIAAAIQKSEGPTHPHTLSVLALLGRIYSEEGKFAEAESLLEQTAHTYADTIGPDKPITLRTRSYLANAYDLQGDLTRAEHLWKDALSRFQQTSGDKNHNENPDAMDISEMLGQNLLKQGKFIEAESLLHRALAFREATQPNDWKRFRAAALLGECEAAQKQWATAEPLLLQGYEGMRKNSALIPARDKKWLKRSGDQIVSLYIASGKPVQATEWRAKL